MRVREFIFASAALASLVSLPPIGGYFYNKGRRDELEHNVKVLEDVRTRLYSNANNMDLTSRRHVLNYTDALLFTTDYFSAEGKRRLGMAPDLNSNPSDPLGIQGIKKIREQLIYQTEIVYLDSDSSATIRKSKIVRPGQTDDSR